MYTQARPTMLYLSSLNTFMIELTGGYESLTLLLQISLTKNTPLIEIN